MDVGPNSTLMVTPTPVVARPRRGLSRNEAATYVGVSTTKFDELVKDDTMPKPSWRFGARVVWDLRRLDDALDKLSPAKDEGDDSWSGF